MLKWTKQHQLQQLQLQQQEIQEQQQRLQQYHATQNVFHLNDENCNQIKRRTKKRYSTGNFIESPRRMPTPMTTQNFNRRLLRRSVDNFLDINENETDRRACYELTANANKENFGVHFVRNSFGSPALQDLSNGRSPRRATEPLQSTPRRLRRRTFGALVGNTQCLNERTPLKGRFSDDFSNANNEDVETLQNMRFKNNAHLQEESLSSSRMGDVTLDRMLDAIIESARKEVIAVCDKYTQEEENADSTPPKQARLETLLNNESALYESETSVHEMEVRTPTHLKRTRVVRRKNTKATEKRLAKPVNEPTKTTPIVHKTAPATVGFTSANEMMRSPETPLFKRSTNASLLLSMRTPPNSINVLENCTETAHVQRCSTPTLEEAQSIKRCLSFSSASDEDDADFSAAKRSSVASSNTSSTTGEHFYSGRTSRTSQHSIKSGVVAERGALDLAVNIQHGKLNVHVIRCRDLHRSNGSTALNAYVKVALVRARGSSVPQQAQPEHCFQRTAVHRHSSRPYFNHRFEFHLGAEGTTQAATAAADERLQLAVWHRDRQLKRSEFLGCLSFPLKTLTQQPINGFYKLQSQACLTNPQPAVPAQVATPKHSAPINIQPTQILTTTAANIIVPPPPTLPTSALTANNEQLEATMSSTQLPHHKSDEDIISIDSMAQAAGGDQQQPMVLSKKALHQRDADENLFLRFLELDPPIDAAPATNTTTTGSTTAVNTASTSTPANAVTTGRLLSITDKPIGRTPFTMTKKLTRTSDRGFGFSIVWTHPPRVEKVESGLSADRAGIVPGDYVIFVDKHNVVTMPEADVLNLIRSQGSTLTLEIFRRSGSGGSQTGRSSAATTAVMNGKNSRVASAASNYPSDELQSTTTIAAGLATTLRRAAAVQQAVVAAPRPPTACSGGTTSSMEAAKKRLNLPQVTFSKESIAPITDNRRRILLQLISREQNFISALHFGMQRFVQPLLERKDLISPNDHRTLFQNIDELLRISEDILEQLCNDEQEPQMNFASRVYLSKTTAICAAYKKYCNGIKRADCVLVNKSRQTGSEFISFITEPQVPRKRPDLTMLVHRPLQHFREILKLMQLLASNCHVDTEEHKNFSTVINELQAAYREITVSSGLMEPLGEGRPLLTLQDLESRMVFTKCKPFTLAVQGRQWIFGGDLSRVEGRSVKPYWTLLFSDIIVFAKVSRDRVLFITEEPIPIANIVDSCFHMRKKTTEFRLTVDPNGRLAESPTGYCAPDLTRTPKKGARRKSLVLRAPSLELKAVWQNLLQRQIFLVNAALGSTPLSSPLDSPDVLNTLVPLSDIGIASASIGSIKLPSMDSINVKNQQQNKRLSSPSDKLDMLIDEKCRILNKTGTPKSSALHLANWMKGQLDKQQEQARLAAARSRENIIRDDDHLLNSESEQEEKITYWTRQQLEKRTKELNLAKENGALKAKANFGGKRLSGVEELSMSDAYSATEDVSYVSQSLSTTSDSKTTVRSSPIVLDKLAVCRHCHKNCQQSAANATSHQQHGGKATAQQAALICNSLKVQHSQSSPHRCCKVNGTSSRTGSITSISSSTITGEHQSERSSKVVASSSGGAKRETTADTESDVAQLITDDLSQSDQTDDSIGAIPSSSSGLDEARRRITDSIRNLRILEDTKLMNGYCTGSSGGESDKKSTKPEPPPRRTPPTSTNVTPKRVADQRVKTTITITETARVVKVQDRQTSDRKATTPTKSPKHAEEKIQSPNSPKSPKSPGITSATSQFIPCNCKCTPADFEHATLSPDEVQQETCKLIESPKQSPRMPRSANGKAEPIHDPHKHCKCICGNSKVSKQDIEDDDLSLMLIGLAQFTPAAKLLNIRTTPTAPQPSPTAPKLHAETNFLPTIAVVPPTPDAVLTKTTTNVWDNSSSASSAHSPTTTITSAKMQLNNVTPGQAVIENIPEDSCDDSPLDEEPPYRPMNNTLRRYGTMSSLEKLPSDERLDDDAELEELDDDDADADADADAEADVDDDEEDDEDLEDVGDDNARADNFKAEADLEMNKATVYETIESASSTSSAMNGNESLNRIAGKMSFFEESRAFIDKYLGRWNQDQGTTTNQVTSEPDEQMDECTSGGTSGEEVWGTPTSGGDNDDMHMMNSENTQSSPTKSSTSLNDDDDTELMMDELLMAPPMTASTIRGLLPRRRLEPLFEEETESDEEKTQQESEEVKKGETTTNGHDLEDSAGSSSDENPEHNPYANEEEGEEDEEPTSTEERYYPNLQTTILGPRPLQNPGIIMPIAVLKASSCEYLLEQRSVVDSQASSSCSNNSPTMTSKHKSDKQTDVISKASETMVMVSTSSIVAKTTTTMRQQHSSISTTTSNENNTTSYSKSSKHSDYYSSSAAAAVTASNSSDSGLMGAARRAEFVPPPPPPRRLLLTQTELKTSGTSAMPKVPTHHEKSGTSADVGSSVDAIAAGVAIASTGIHKSPMPKPPRSTRTIAPTATNQPRAAFSIQNSVANIASTGKHPSSTIIETSLLGSASQRISQHSTSSTTVSKRQTQEARQQLAQERQTDTGIMSSTQVEEKKKEKEKVERAADSTKPAAQVSPGSRLSPRLEMRLALNNDILGDEDLICYDPGPDLITILGHDLSTFQRLTGRDLLNRSAMNRVQPREAVISYSQQRNSKMDTPTVNRRPRPGLSSNNNSSNSSSSNIAILTGSVHAEVGGAAATVASPHLLPNRNIWSSSASADLNIAGSGARDERKRNYSCSSDESKLSDLEILARREKIYSMSQSKSGLQVKTATMTTTTTTTMLKSTQSSNNLLPTINPHLMRTMSTTSMGVGEIDNTHGPHKTGHDDEVSLTDSNKGKRFINFLKRRNSEVPESPNCSQISLSESNMSSITPVHKNTGPISPRKDNDKPSLNRRLWKQITKRRRANSVSEITAS